MPQVLQTRPKNSTDTHVINDMAASWERVGTEDVKVRELDISNKAQ